MQAYYVIKAAQEREELQRQGDELDARVRKAERECQGLQAALNKLMGTNLDLNASFRQAVGQGRTGAAQAPAGGTLILARVADALQGEAKVSSSCKRRQPYAFRDGELQGLL